MRAPLVLSLALLLSPGLARAQASGELVPPAPSADVCTRAALAANEREQGTDLALAEQAAREADAVRTRGPKLALLLSLPFLGGALLNVALDDDPGGLDAAAVAITGVAPLTSGLVWIERASHAARLRREWQQLRARARYLAALRADCALDPAQTGLRAHARELEALRVELAIADVTARIREHPRTLPTLMTIGGGVGTVGFVLGSLLVGRFREGYRSEPLSQEDRRMKTGLGVGAALSFGLLVGGAIWNIRSGIARRTLAPELRRLRQEKERLLPVLAPVPAAHGASLVLSGQF